jgi:dienelactone hydrolase
MPARTWWRVKLLLVAVSALLMWPAAQRIDWQPAYAGDGLVAEDILIPAAGHHYAIATRILRPEGPGPYGAIILSHGEPATAEQRMLESPDMLLDTAAVLARRGYAVIMPLRRGYGATGGVFAEYAGSCGNPDYLRSGAAAAADILTAYDFARRLPYVDGNRMILAGQSAGAVASLFAAAAREPQGLVAVLAFAAGRGGDPARTPGMPCAAEQLAEVFALLGARVKAPVLFQYAENDLFFGPGVTRLWFERFTKGGARAEYVLQPPFGANGHFLFSDDAGARYWEPAVERFLRQYGVPFEAKARA